MNIFKKNPGRGFAKTFAVLTACFIFSSCVTSITANIERPAELDLGGANRIAVIPFQTSDNEKYNDSHSDRSGSILLAIGGFIFDAMQPSPNEGVQKDIAEYITGHLTEAVNSSNYFKMVEPQKVLSALKENKTVPTDVYLTGKIRALKTDIDEDKKTVEKTDSNGNKTTSVEWSYCKTVETTVSYSVVSAKDNIVIGTREKTLKKSSSYYSSRRSLPDEMDLLKSELDSLISKIMHEIQPYTITKKLDLLKDKSKDDRMKKANDYAKDGKLNDALKIYKSVYKENKNFEAGYNAAQILIAKNEFNEARSLMEKLYSSTGDKRASDSLKLINEEIVYAERLKKQQEARKQNGSSLQ